MKVRLLPIGVLIAVFFLQITGLFAQGNEALSNPLEPDVKRQAIYIGPVIGYNRAMHKASLASFDDKLCPTFSNGVANGFYAGLSLEYLIGKAASSKHSVIARILYNTMPASFLKTGDDYPSLVRKSDTQVDTIRSFVRHTIDVTYNSITIEAVYKFNIVGGFGITVGPSVDFPIKKTLVQKMELYDPPYAQFIPDTTGTYRYSSDYRTIFIPIKPNYASDQIPDAASIRFALKAGVQYEILLGKWYIVPTVAYNLGLTNLTSVTDKSLVDKGWNSWKVDALQIGIDLRYALSF